MNCVFCNIASKKLPSQMVFENESIFAFKDLNPAAPVHILIIPKKHISSGADDIDEESGKIVGEIFTQIPEIAKEAGLINGFRVVTNCGEDGGQTIPHLHFHILGGKALGGMVSE